MLRKDREGRGHTSDNLRDEEVEFVLSNPASNLRPGSSQGEELAASLLLADDVRFTFTAHGEGREHHIYQRRPRNRRRYRETPKVKENSNRRFNSQPISNEWFSSKRSNVDNPMRNGDALAVSALDLVGRKMSWDPLLTRGDGRKPTWNLISFAIRFQNENDGGRFQNVALIEPKQMSLEVTPQLLGLKRSTR